jgi:hypothetical protein
MPLLSISFFLVIITSSSRYPLVFKLLLVLFVFKSNPSNWSFYLDKVNSDKWESIPNIIGELWTKFIGVIYRLVIEFNLFRKWLEFKYGEGNTLTNGVFCILKLRLVVNFWDYKANDWFNCIIIDYNIYTIIWLYMKL